MAPSKVSSRLHVKLLRRLRRTPCRIPRCVILPSAMASGARLPLFVGVGALPPCRPRAIPCTGTSQPAARQRRFFSGRFEPVADPLQRSGADTPRRRLPVPGRACPRSSRASRGSASSPSRRPATPSRRSMASASHAASCRSLVLVASASVISLMVSGQSATLRSRFHSPCGARRPRGGLP